ncbi:hypothetical protein C8R44DRAFT_896139 [Mycena epipterygia]|nr:hypothetical protein C8R44DRAFT_896139 [Mycena epipterygia]
MNRLEFALGHCVSGYIDITLSLRDVRKIFSLPATCENVERFVDAIFCRIGPYSTRWRSFTLVTENPYVFSRVHHHCATLTTDSLTKFDVSYVYMPGYSPHISNESIYEVPFAADTPWFGDTMPRITHLKLFCVPIRSEAVLQFEFLEVVELTDFLCPAAVDPGFLPSLFAVAVNMRVLRIGALLLQFPLPKSFRLYSASLRILDLEFYHGAFCGDLLSMVDAPRLTDLTVREVYDHVHSLLASLALLSQITHFRVYSEIGDDVSLQHLFSALPHLRVLDLLHTHSYVFDAYTSWAISRVRFGLPNTAANLTELYVGRVDLDSVLKLVWYLRQTSNSACSLTGVDKVRVERPARPFEVSSLTLELQNAVADFAFTDVYTPSSYLNYHTAHSLFRYPYN